jgi:protoheme IX farnesyltransferase
MNKTMTYTAMPGILRTFLELIKIRIALFSSLTVLAGFVFAVGRVTFTAFITTACVFILAAGSCALNEYQEREVDALQERTSGRPIPTKRLSPVTALLIAIVLISSGFFLLDFTAGWIPATLGGFAALWYNGVYTPLKRRMPFAAVAGALSGALPPCVGWTAAGGSLGDPRIQAVALFFFLWQIPHFWLLLLSRGEHVVKHRGPEGLAPPAGILERTQLLRLSSVWICATAVLGMLLPLFGLVQSLWAMIILVGSSIGLLIPALRLPLRPLQRSNPGLALGALHAFTLITVLTAVADRLINP